MTSTPNAASRHLPERHLSRLIIEQKEGEEALHHTLSVVELHRDDSGSIKSYTITPYAGETPFTTYHDRPLQLTVTAEGTVGFRF